MRLSRWFRSRPRPIASADRSRSRKTEEKRAGFRPFLVEPLESRDLLAAVPVGAEFRVNTVTASFQNDPSVAFDANGNYVVAWTSYLQDGSSNGIYAQRYSSNGAALGAEFRVNTFTTGLQAGAAVARSAAGDFVVTWASLGQDGSGLSVHAQRFDAAGVALGTEFQVNTFTTGNQFAPAIALNADGDFVIAWESFGQDGAGYGVYAQRYNANGTAQGPEFQVNTFTTGNQRNATVALDGEGNFVVAWASNGQDASGYGVYAQRFAAAAGAGGAAGAEFRVNTVTSGDQATPTIGMAPGGEFVIAWASNGQDGSGVGVYAQRYAAGGAAQGPEFRVNSFTTGSQRAPTIAVDDTGDFVVAWESFAQDGSGYGIFAQKYNSTGVAQEAEFRVNSFTTGVQRDAAVGMDGAGNFLVAWNSDAQDGSLLGVYAQQYALPPRIVDVINPALDQSILGTQPALGTAVSQLAVSFDQVMATSGTGSVTQLGHWGLAREATDLSALITGITAGTNAMTGRFEATLALSSALTPGDYQLTVRATLASAFGLALDGNGDTVAGGDYLAAFTIAPLGPAGGQFLVNSFTTGIQRDAAIAADPAGNFVIAWSSTFQDGSLGGIYAQRYSAAGVPLGGEFRVNSTTSNEQGSPSIAMNAAGDFVIAWASFGQDGSNFGVYAQRYSKAGVALGGEFRVNSHTTDSQFAPTVAMDAAGNFVVAWNSTGQDGSGVGVYAQRYDASGTPLGAEFRVNTFTTDAQRDASVAMDAAGNFVVAWTSANQDGDSYGVYAQRYGAAGAPLGSEFRVNALTSGVQFDPAVALDAAGNFVIAWNSSSFAGGSNEVRAQRYGATGTPLGGEFRVKGTMTGTIIEPTIAIDGHGNFTAAWTSAGEDGSLYGVYAQRFARPVPVASLQGPATTVRGEPTAFAFFATTAEVPLGNYSFQVDWENDGVFDQTVVGPSGTAINHVFAAAGARTVRVVALDDAGQESAPVLQGITVNAFELRGNDLIWGGTEGIDAFFFVPGAVLTQALNNQFFATLQITPVGAFAGKLVVYAQGGNDLVFCDVVTSAIELFGDEGDDVLIGGRGSDLIDGGAGADILFGGTLSTDGADTLLGGDGDDLLVGHLGADRLEGGSGKDLLMAGSLGFGPDLPAAVFSIQAEWTSSRPLTQKVANLTGTGSGPRNNGNIFLVGGTTALDDTSIDTLLAGVDQDWYIGDLAQDLFPDIGPEDDSTGI